MKNFLLYFGQPRTASTWLYGVLNERDDCEFSHIKEYFLCRDFTLNPEFDKSTFFEHYMELASNPEIKLLGEMSTSNCSLSEEEARWFKTKLNDSNFTVLPLVTLRDPIDQMLSSTKLGLRVERLFHDHPDGNLLELTSEIDAGIRQPPEIEMTADSIIHHHRRPELRRQRIYWRKTFEMYQRVFGKLHVNFYETLHTEQSMSKLCEYLQIPMTEFDYSRIAHKMGDSISLTNEEKQRIYDSFDDIKSNYDFAVEKFGKDLIESIWWTPNK